MNGTLPNTIFMTADTVGGVWTYALDLCDVLQKNNVKVHLATMGAPLSSSQSTAVNKLSNVEIHESDFSLEWMNDPWDEVDEAGIWLSNLEKQIQPDVIHLNNFAHGSLPWNAPVVMVAHSCVLSWWEAVKGEKAPPEWNTYKERVQQGLMQADSVVAVSRHMLQMLKTCYGPLGQSEVIYNTRNPENFYSSQKENLIFSMGRLWDEAKNISALKQIAGNLAWPVYLAGEEGRSTNRLPDNIIPLGKISPQEAARFLSKTPIYVMPARYEPFGLSILEAALSGCALVLGNIPALREIWGDAAIYADPDNPDELQHKISRLIKNPLTVNEKAQEAGKRAKLYSMDRFENKYINLYKKMHLMNQKEEISRSA